MYLESILLMLLLIIDFLSQSFVPLYVARCLCESVRKQAAFTETLTELMELNPS
jgi:hypothetical protein